MARIFYQQDCDLQKLSGKTVAIIGYGSQGHAHALNLKDSGVDVIVGLYEGSKSWAKAEAQGLRKVMTSAEAAKAADIIMILINDEKQAALYKGVHRAQSYRGQDPCVRTRLQYPFRLHQASEECKCYHDRPQRAPDTPFVPSIRQVRAFRVLSPSSRMQRATLGTSASHMHSVSAEQERAF